MKPQGRKGGRVEKANWTRVNLKWRRVVQYDDGCETQDALATRSDKGGGEVGGGCLKCVRSVENILAQTKK